MSDEAECVRIDTRLAGQVRRYHTWPIVGQQTVAEHCWQILRIYLSVTERIDSQMMYHIVFHDIGEHYTGDIPYPVKRDNKVLKEQMDFMEHRSYCTQLEYWGAFEQVRLNEEEMKLFKQIELIEMAEFGLEQMCYGNYYGYVVANRCLQAVYSDNPSRRLADYVARRIHLFNKQYSGHASVSEWWLANNWEKLHANGKSDPNRRDPL